MKTNIKIKILIAVVLLGYLFNNPLAAQTRGWGNNEDGELGLGNGVSPQPNPVTLGVSADDVTSISGGYFHTLFLKADGTVQATGGNNSGQLGDGTTNTRTTLEAVNGLSNVVAVSAGRTHSLALLSDGTVMGWGSNSDGQLGGGGGNCNGNPYCVTPVVIPGLTNIIAIDAGRDHSLALKSDGTVWAWGRNNNGQIGDGTTEPPALAVQVGIGVSGFSNIIAVSGGEFHSIALKSDGTVWVWGSNLYGTIGNGAAGGNQLLPVQNTNITGVSQITAGFNFNVALKPDGTVFAWGFNIRGNVGNGTSGSEVLTPVQSAITNVIDIKTAGVHTLAKKSDGSIWAWGWNQHGEIGIGVVDTNFMTCECRSTPVQTLNGAGNPVFGAGYNHSFIAKPLITLQPGSNITIYGENFNLLFSSIASVTTISILAIDPNSTGLTVPTGYTILPNSPAYNITASPAVTGLIIPCIKVSNVFSQTQFANLRMMHGEGDALIDRTVLPNNYQSREIEGSVTSLSPFVIAEQFAPTAASVTVGGRVTTADGRGISRARVALTGANGETRQTITNSFGYYRFDEVQAGETFVFFISHKRYQFAPQVLTVNEEFTELNFTSEN